MDVTRAISNILPPPTRREDGGAHQFGRRSAAAAQEDARVEEAPALGAGRHHARDDIKTGRETSPVPVKLREIQSTFTSSREAGTSLHMAYSAPFLAQQLAQQDDAVTEADPAEAHRRATSAYDSSLNLTATVLGFDGHAERVA
ncbi:hypothetical protein [Sneathiella sp.]|uniref:hypothetical protein n=1 Tax=Sneathiella sp. TaxID=1964365 RepID=UPI00260420F5|nr:hypothetical protein [Sneathiella sp.]MDF2368889.1 hypothetical protein [Sneathiella sp.]